MKRFADQGNLLATPFTVKEKFVAPNFRGSRSNRENYAPRNFDAI